MRGISRHLARAWSMAVFWLAALSLLLPALPARGLQVAPLDPRFGLVEAYVNPEAAGEAGAGYTRVILRWDVIQPAGRDDWKPANVPDPLIAGELAAGRQVVGLLIGTPAWAISPDFDGEISSRAVPDLYAWEAYVRRMAQHYQGRISHWVIWNEPDVWMEGHPGRTWDGTEEDYARLLKVAYQAIKGVDPSMTVALAGLTYYWDWEHGRLRYLDRLLEVIEADPEASGQGFFFDAVVYHLYFNPRQTVDVIEETRQSLAAHGIGDKAIWINETNAPPSADPQEPPWSEPRFQVTLAEQAAFILQQFALAFAHGADRVQVYKLRNTADHPESIEPFGLLRADDSRRPAFAAYQVAATYLRDFVTAYEERQGDVVAVTFERQDQTSTVLWTDSRAPARVRVNAIAPQALVVDEQGNSSEIWALGGAYVLELPGASCSQQPGCFIGGAPRVLVEIGRAGGRQALASAAGATAQAQSTAKVGIQPDVPSQAQPSATSPALSNATPSAPPATTLAPTPAVPPTQSPAPLVDQEQTPAELALSLKPTPLHATPAPAVTLPTAEPAAAALSPPVPSRLPAAAPTTGQLPTTAPSPSPTFERTPGPTRAGQRAVIVPLGLTALLILVFAGIVARRR